MHKNTPELVVVCPGLTGASGLFSYTALLSTFSRRGPSNEPLASVWGLDSQTNRQWDKTCKETSPFRMTFSHFYLLFKNCCNAVFNNTMKLVNGLLTDNRKADSRAKDIKHVTLVCCVFVLCLAVSLIRKTKSASDLVNFSQFYLFFLWLVNEAAFTPSAMLQ